MSLFVGLLNKDLVFISHVSENCLLSCFVVFSLEALHLSSFFLFFVWSPKVISFRCLPNKKSLFPTILREMSPLVFRCCFSLGALLLSSFFPLCLISESCFPFVYYLTRVGCLRMFSFDLFLPKGLCHLSVSEKDVWLPIPFNSFH